jgi:DNA invertase Pin-like site-specific DNA recombinase
LTADSRNLVNETDDSVPQTPLRVVGYLRVSTSEQAESGAGLEAQREAIRAEAARREWTLMAIYEDTASGKSTLGREGLMLAVEAVEHGEAAALVVAKLDRLSRSLIDFAALMERSRKKGWALVALDLGVDTTTPSGELMASVLAVFAQFERRLIGQRTRDALAVKRAAGVRLGRPPALPMTLVRRLDRERRDGATLQQIADRLNAEGIATAHGGVRWYRATVGKVLASQRLAS